MKGAREIAPLQLKPQARHRVLLPHPPLPTARQPDKLATWWAAPSRKSEGQLQQLLVLHAICFYVSAVKFPACWLSPVATILILLLSAIYASGYLDNK